MVVTVTLGRGALRLAKLGVIAKRLPAIHDLGAMDTLCTDKTGTLTEAKIRLVRHVDADGAECPKVLRLACLNSAFETGIHSPLDDAILAHAKPDAGEWTKLDEVPFDFERRRVSVLLQEKGDDGASADRQGCAGGCAQALHASPLGRRRCDAFERGIARSYRRDLCEARRRRLPASALPSARSAPSKRLPWWVTRTDLIFAGFVVFLDPPKESASRAIAQLAASGVAIKISPPATASR